MFRDSWIDRENRIERIALNILYFVNNYSPIGTQERKRQGLNFRIKLFRISKHLYLECKFILFLYFLYFFYLCLLSILFFGLFFKKIDRCNFFGRPGSLFLSSPGPLGYSLGFLKSLLPLNVFFTHLERDLRGWKASKRS